MCNKKRVGVIGAGLSGLVSAYVLAKAGVDVVLYEKESYLQLAKTFTVDGVDLDLSFMAFNRVTSPNMMDFFEMLGLDMEISDMSFSLSLDDHYEWGNRNGLSSLFAQKKNVLNPYFLKTIREITKVKDDVLSHTLHSATQKKIVGFLVCLQTYSSSATEKKASWWMVSVRYLEHHQDIDNETLGEFIKSHGYSELFQKAYLVPISYSFWPCPTEGLMRLSAFSVLSYFYKHHLFQLFNIPQWFTLRHGSQTYVKKVREELESRGCQIRMGSAVQSITKLDDGCLLVCEDGSQERYHGCIIDADAPHTLTILGEQATNEEKRILNAFDYVFTDVFLHRDKNLMPQNQTTWSALNFVGTKDKKASLTYWLNVLQNIDENGLPFLVSVNPSETPKNSLLKWTTRHPVPSVAASKASLQLHTIQGNRGIWFCGSYQGCGFHEDRLKAGMVAANGFLGTSCEILSNPKHMELSLMEAGARSLVVRFFRDYITMGTLVLLEGGGTTFTFEGTRKNSSMKVCLKVHSPQFYWKMVTEADVGFADAYINGDFSFVDKTHGLLNMIMMFIVNNDLKYDASMSKKRGWWTPMFSTAMIASAKYTYRHLSKQNTVTQARRNISRHYDQSNELFSLILDKTMSYSCPIFKSEDEDLEVAQMRKYSLLIKKARVDKNHHVLEIGFGWGTLATEIVKQTGCKYTGITLSEEQHKYAESKVKEAGLQEKIRLLLCDYRELRDTYKYDRIIACEMIEHVGHEYYEEFFSCCESVLTDDGILLLQFSAIVDGRYDEWRRNPGFLNEYIFPGGCLPSFSRVTAAVVGSTRLCVDNVEYMRKHYYRTLRQWRINLMKNQSKILALGFNKELIHSWEYYLDYCAAGFMTDIVGSYQVVFSRHGNVAALEDPYKGVV